MCVDAIRGNSIYYQYHHSMLTEQEILEDMEVRPPHTQAEDKYYLGFFQGQKLLAILDLIANYPQPGAAFVGFFALASSMHGQGLGTELVQELFEKLKQNGFTRIRLGIDEGNPQSFAFWSKNGFALTGEKKTDGEFHYLPMERCL